MGFTIFSGPKIIACWFLKDLLFWFQVKPLNYNLMFPGAFSCPQHNMSHVIRNPDFFIRKKKGTYWL